MRSFVGVGVLALILQATASFGAASTQTLYATSFQGPLITLDLEESATRSEVSLSAVDTKTDCGVQSTWLAYDSHNSVLYCLDESWVPENGSITSYRVAPDGTLTRLDKIQTTDSPVSALIYGQGGRGLAVSYYDGHGFGTFDISDPSNIKPLQTFLYPKVDGRESKVHHVVLEPKNRKHLIAPDLGQDLVRVYSINPTSLELRERPSLHVAPGSGPRHVAFTLNTRGATMYLISELSNTITVFNTTWAPCGDVLSFEELFKMDTHGEHNLEKSTVPAGTTAAEIVVTADQNYVIVSSRNESSLQIPKISGSSVSNITSDPLISFKINSVNGDLELLQIAPAGGKTPRHFSVNKAGDRVAVGLQSDGRVVVIERDPKTGLLGDFLAAAEGLGKDPSISNVIFRE